MMSISALLSLTVVLLAWGSAASTTCKSIKMLEMETLTDGFTPTGNITPRSSTTLPTLTNTVTSFAAIRRGTQSSEVTVSSSTQSVTLSTKVTTSSISSNSTILAPTGISTPTNHPGAPINATRPVYTLAPTPAKCPENNNTLARPDSVALFLIQCDIDWTVLAGTAYGKGLGESYQESYEGCSKHCVGDPEGFCRAFVYKPAGAKPGVPNCFLRKFGNSSAISAPGSWGGVLFRQGINGQPDIIG
ncbi:hypothetical protein QBC39DRAFT_15537 [Podospora conica]|nr:hypothetical protein QBC39DRAFT_15537 [Schizothecium conicum]